MNDERYHTGRAAHPAVMLRILESITAPAIVCNSHVDDLADYLAANPLGRALGIAPSLRRRGVSRSAQPGKR